MLTIYFIELEIKVTRGSGTSVSYMDTLLEKDINSNVTKKLYDKRDDFDF